ncbi:hypothetical protein GCM10027280_34010 [Micromonospora polyrhachis]|uniref:Uncharacterized protein n=1 Tax=Micromonospora polyrhachis TaxID=1282883 RepID=A0A7W7SRA1_9ACTN|nr:DUF6023 family protein [Micromonospora polyrhachis]MBB4959527.1 hypothetical protein [Micromonospora polyrhachis]
MDAGREGWLRGLLLAALALGVLAVGGRWWVVSAPEVIPLSAPRATPSPTSEPSYRASARVLVGVEPTTGRTMTKYFLAEPDSRTLRTPAHSGGLESVDSMLPRLPDRVRRDVTILPGGGKLDWGLTVDAGRYHLQYLCVGPGELIIQVAVGQAEPPAGSVPCDGPGASMVFSVDRAKQVRILVLRPGSQSVAVGIQLAPADDLVLPFPPG